MRERPQTACISDAFDEDTDNKSQNKVSQATLKRRAEKKTELRKLNQDIVKSKSRERKPIFQRKMNTNFFANEGSSEVEIYEGSKKTYTEKEEHSLENFCVVPQKTKNSEKKVQKQPEKEFLVQKPAQNEDIMIFESKHKPLFKVSSDSDPELGAELEALDNREQRVAPTNVEPEYRVTLDSPGQQQREDVVQAVVNKYAQYDRDREPRKTWESTQPNPS